MAIKLPGSFSEYFFKHRIMLLLITILSFIIGGPFVDDIFHFEVIPDIFLTIIFTFGIYAISRKKKDIYIALFLAVPMYIATWSSHLLKNIDIFIVGHLFGAILIGFLIKVLINFIFFQKEVTKEIIFAAVVVYLLLALLWAFAYSILDYFYPNSVRFPEISSPDFYRYLYFSFVTITTLGYGDVLPLTQKAGSLVILEAVTGQIYLVVVVAWLVGMYVSRRLK